MKPLRRFSIIAVTSLLRLSLFFGVSLAAAIVVVGHPGHIEHTLSSTGTYKQLVPSVLQTLGSASHDSGGIPFKDPGVQKIVNESLPPQVIQTSAESVINGTYGWLGGKTLHPLFRVDLTKNRELVTENLTAYAFNRLAQQPLCATQPETVDPFTAQCLPRNYDIHEERSAFASEINALFPKTVFTANDLPRFAGGKSIAHDFPQAARLYRLALAGPWLLGALFVVLSVLLMLLCCSVRKGWKLLASVIISSGVALAVTPLLYLLVYPHINHALTLQSTNTGINIIINNLVAALSHDFNDYILKGSLLVVNLGLVILLVERLSRQPAYSQLATRAGIATSEPGAQQGSTGSVTASMVPLQSSEQSVPKKSKRRFAINRKPEDGAS